MAKYDVFVIADLCIDLLFTGTVRPKYGQAEQLIDDYTVDLGGSAAIFASQFAKLGGNVGFLAKVGNDLFGNILLEKIKSIGISSEHISIDETHKTAAGIGLSDGQDRAMLTYMGTLLSVKPEDIKDEFIKRTKHWHIASYFLLENLWDFWILFLQKLKQQGLTVSLDTNWAPKENWQQVHNILPYIDVFLPNEEEAKLISGEKNVIEAGKWLSDRCNLVVIKCGGDGAMAFQKEKIYKFDIPIHLTENLMIADTTGAGDNFDAGFLHNWLLNKALEECIKLGMECGTRSLSAIGGIEGQIIP
ncbi:MAG: carbohydrate kinase family protein [Saprospiraceae bacterium]|nr:carbohydrate kinase family protein [Saprospiraceae bacterium]